MHDEPNGSPDNPGTAALVTEVAARTAAEAGVSVDLLGEYLQILSDAATEGRRPEPSQLTALRQLGELAATAGVDADQAVDLYLSAAWHLWRAMPATVGSAAGGTKTAAETMLRVVNEAVEVLIDGHQAAGRAMIRREESVRREFIDDLLRGDADVARLIQRAQPFGLDLGRGHQVLLAEPAATSAHQLERAAGPIERVVVDRYGDREVLVATKDTFLVVILPAEHGAGATPAGTDRPAATEYLRHQLRRHTGHRHWQVASGQPHPGAYGIAHSYEQAREALRLARRLQLDAATIGAQELLLYRVIGRDQTALVDLVHGLLTPLTRARGGAEPLLHTLETYFATGAVATETARRLHVSVRTVTYRLARIEALTGSDPADPGDSLALQIAVLGARLLDWPAAGSVAAPVS